VPPAPDRPESAPRTTRRRGSSRRRRPRCRRGPRAPRRPQPVRSGWPPTRRSGARRRLERRGRFRPCHACRSVRGGLRAVSEFVDTNCQLTRRVGALRTEAGRPPQIARIRVIQKSWNASSSAFRGFPVASETSVMSACSLTSPSTLRSPTTIVRSIGALASRSASAAVAFFRCSSICPLAAALEPALREAALRVRLLHVGGEPLERDPLVALVNTEREGVRPDEREGESSGRAEPRLVESEPVAPPVERCRLDRGR